LSRSPSPSAVGTLPFSRENVFSFFFPLLVRDPDERPYSVMDLSIVLLSATQKSPKVFFLLNLDRVLISLSPARLGRFGERALFMCPAYLFFCLPAERNYYFLQGFLLSLRRLPPFSPQTISLAPCQVVCPHPFRAI